MLLTHEHVGSKKPAKINTYTLTRAELLINLCYQTPCTMMPQVFVRVLEEFEDTKKTFRN